MCAAASVLLTSLSPKESAMQSFSPLPRNQCCSGVQLPQQSAAGITGCHLPWGVQLSLGSLSWPHLDSCWESPALAYRSQEMWSGMEVETPLVPRQMGHHPSVYDKQWWVYLNQTLSSHFRNEEFKSSRMQPLKNHVVWPAFPTRLSTLHHQPSESPTAHSESNFWWKCLNT